MTEGQNQRRWVPACAGTTIKVKDTGYPRSQVRRSRAKTLDSRLRKNDRRSKSKTLGTRVRGHDGQGQRRWLPACAGTTIKVKDTGYPRSQVRRSRAKMLDSRVRKNDGRAKSKTLDSGVRKNDGRAKSKSLDSRLRKNDKKKDAGTTWLDQKTRPWPRFLKKELNQPRSTDFRYSLNCSFMPE
ncbi:hypothetical protein SAMN04488540_1303 [Ferrimonas sediminum]|uniref:Uncharacterized protein n=1 Tax=Ferrimonas sediminum TaxID=718193 RepID=A0A1G9BIP3_9GAMM|nr:hypothetical protein SAMN04488540_1303 [Ferrimonas sediminum]